MRGFDAPTSGVLKKSSMVCRLELGSSWAAGFVLVLGVAGGCGLRSDPLFLEGDSEAFPSGDSTDAEPILDPNRMGACAAPFEIPAADGTIDGSLPDGHGSLYDGACGRGDGPEDVYTFTSPFDTDVTIRLGPGTTFSPTLRVQQDGCGDEGFTQVCTPDALSGPGIYFLARANTTYFVTVDSRSTDDAGDYTLQVSLAPPALDLCPIHPTAMEQVPGAAFLWSNEFSEGYGQVTSFCGGAGRENMFRLDATYSGNIFAQATGTGGFVPSLSLRTGCGATTELVCAAEGDTGIPGVAEFSWFIDPGTYYVVVDQIVPSDGFYDLRVDFQ